MRGEALGSRGLIPAVIISIRIFLLPLIYILWTAFDAREGKNLWKLDVHFTPLVNFTHPGPWLADRPERGDLGEMEQ